MFELSQVLRDSTVGDLNCSYKAFFQKEALTICQDRVFPSILCVHAIIISFKQVHTSVL